MSRGELDLMNTNRVFAWAIAALWLTACAPEIGDDCITSTDCSQQGDRLCDTTQPGGYCTVFNCEPDTCPEDDGVCVAFKPELDAACGAADDASWPRFERAFCLKECEEDGDCRPGYACVAPAALSAIILDREPIGTSVCVVASSAQSTPPAATPGVCDPPVNDQVPEPYEPEPSSDAASTGVLGVGGLGAAPSGAGALSGG